MIQDFADNVDWFTVFGVQTKEIASCCVCGGPAHDAQSGYCRSKSLRYIKECLSGLLGTPEVSQETGGLMIQTTEFNGSAWRALVIAGCRQGESILPLYTACAWGEKGDQIRKWGVGHVVSEQRIRVLGTNEGSRLGRSLRREGERCNGRHVYDERTGARARGGNSVLSFDII